MIIVIEAGCAECHGWGDGPLVTIHQFPSVEDAKDWAQSQGWLTVSLIPGKPLPLTWKPHPQGGEHVVVSQGSVWITPMATPARMFEELP